MDSRAAEQLLYDSEATLRLVDSLLDELQGMEAEIAPAIGRLSALSIQMERVEDQEPDLPDLLLHARQEVCGVLDRLTQSRDVLERTMVEKLEPVRNQDPLCATDLRYRVERALELVVRLDEGNDPAFDRFRLRQELLHLLEHARAQEITEQQLSYVTSVLRDSESRLSVLSDELASGIRGSSSGPTNSDVDHGPQRVLDIFRPRVES